MDFQRADGHHSREPGNGAGQRRCWKIVGGDGRGGLLVRAGPGLSSGKTSERLGSGALVEELSFSDDRLQFRKLFGVGPVEGWVTVSLFFKVLAERMVVSEAPLLRGLQAMQEAHVQLPPCERRLRSWSHTLALSMAWLQMAKRIRRGTSVRPIVLWVFGASAEVEGSLADAGYFDDVNAFDGAACELVFWGSSGHATQVGQAAPAKDKPPRFCFKDHSGLPSADEVGQQPDLIAVLMPGFTEHADGRLSISRAFLPDNPAKAIGSKPVVVSTRFNCVPGDESLLDQLEGRAPLIMRRNVLSALCGDTGVACDDNGWITCVDGIEGLNTLLKQRFVAPAPNQQQDNSKLSALFWGIVDLKYDPGKPLQERVRILELGDGRSSKFSNDGAQIAALFKTTYTLEDPSVMGLRSLICVNKKLTHDLIEYHGYAHLLPRQVCLPRIYDRGLAGRIAKELHAGAEDLVVLKLLNRSRGAGVLPVPAKTLDQVLQDVLLVPADLPSWFREQAGEGSSPLPGIAWGCFEEHKRNWWSNECPYFVAEQFCTSEPVNTDNKRFEGTLRVAFALRSKGQRLRLSRRPQQSEEEAGPPLPELAVDWLGGYWKLPKGDMDSPDLRERVVSAARVAGTATVDPTQLFEVYAALGDLLQRLFGGPEPDLDLVQQHYGKEPAFASYLAARFSVSTRSTKSAEAMLQVAGDLLSGADDGAGSRCAGSYASRCLGVLQAMRTGGSWEEAAAWFRRSLEQMPSNTTSLYLLGMAALETGESEQAADWMTKALLLDPDFKAPYANLGAAYLRLQQYDEAIAVSEAGLERHPGTPHCHYHIGVACYQKAVLLQAQLGAGRGPGAPHAGEAVRCGEVQELGRLRERALSAMSESRAHEDWPSRPSLHFDNAIFGALQSEAALPEVQPPAALGWCFVGRVGRRVPVS